MTQRAWNYVARYFWLMIKYGVPCFELFFKSLTADSALVYRNNIWNDTVF